MSSKLFPAARSMAILAFVLGLSPVKALNNPAQAEKAPVQSIGEKIAGENQFPELIVDTYIALAAADGKSAAARCIFDNYYASQDAMRATLIKLRRIDSPELFDAISKVLLRPCLSSTPPVAPQKASWPTVRARAAGDWPLAPEAHYAEIYNAAAAFAFDALAAKKLSFCVFGPGNKPGPHTNPALLARTDDAARAALAQYSITRIRTECPEFLSNAATLSSLELPKGPDRAIVASYRYLAAKELLACDADPTAAGCAATAEEYLLAPLPE